MLLYKLLLQSDIPETRPLFYHASADMFLREDGLHFGTKSTVSFDSFFNCFSYTKYREYCSLKTVILSLRGKGTFRLELFLKKKNGKSTLLRNFTFNDNFRTEIPLSGLPKDGYLYFTLTAGGGAVFYAGSYETEDIAPSTVKIGIVICTYKRENFVKANLRRITDGLDRSPELKDSLHVFIVDNAKTLDLPANEVYTVLPNPNLGGSGGFTRGIMTVCDDPSFTHFLLMDDDICFEFGTVERTIALLQALSGKYADASVGGAMLYLDRPTIQHEFGGTFTGVRYVARNSGLDLSLPNNLTINEFPKTPVNYNAWWYCCMPVTTVEKYGLPMPFFIKGDDAEYGIRCINDLILMNGIAVWHQDFSYKYNPSLEYYSHRNSKTVSAIHFRTPSPLIAYHFLYSVFSQLTQKRYFCAELILQAYKDLLKGFRFWLDTDMEKLNAEVMGKTPKRLSAAELKEELDLPVTADFSTMIPCRRSHQKNIFRTAILATENFLPACFFRNAFATTDANKNIARTAFLRKTVLLYDKSNDSGYICRLDVSRRKKIKKETVRLFFKILIKFPGLRKEYSTCYRLISSPETWAKKFDV